MPDPSQPTQRKLTPRKWSSYRLAWCTLMAEEARFSKWLAQEAQLSQKHEEMYVVLHILGK